MKEIVILGGPNGAGKTTAALVLLKEFLKLHAFVNADELARSAEVGQLGAGRLMLERMRELISEPKSFAIETTCAGKAYVPIFKKCKAAEWRITLIYLWLPSPETAVARVARRVSEGGHDIPVETIRRRFYSGLRNLIELYLPLADTAAVYDNSGAERRLIAERELGQHLVIRDPARWRRIQEQMQCT